MTSNIRQRRVVYANECEPCDLCDEPICPVCHEHYAECPCPGPHSVSSEHIEETTENS